MEPGKAAKDLLAALDAFSGHKLTRRNDLATLAELAFANSARGALDELGFLAKFITMTHRIMQRIGKDGEGYGRLLGEFSEAITKTRDLFDSLLANAPQQMRDHFSIAYGSMTHESMQNFLALCYDLSWYKNWLIDQQRLSYKP